MSDPLEDALARLEALAKAHERARSGRSPRRLEIPTRYDARALLVPLGERLRDGGSSAVEAALERARAAGRILGKAWNDAVRGELDLAAAEHVLAVDPRYLDLPNYDFAYTVAARERLEARLLAAAELDLEIPSAMLARIEDADARLAPYLERDAPGAADERP